MSGAIVGATDFTGIAVLVTALGTFVVACATARVTWRKVDDVKTEVVTGNTIKAGAVIAQGETRRIEELPHDERTVAEQEHLNAAPPDDPPQGPGR